MILDVSYKTDVVAFYADWFMNRIRDGYYYQQNSYDPRKVNKVSLDPSVVDVIVFCSKNYKPLMPYIDELESKYRCYYYYTITPYGRDIEPGSPSVEESIQTLIELSNKVGKNKVGLRYDPILFTTYWNRSRHALAFKYILDKVSAYIDRVVFSFVQPYEKTKNNMPEIIYPDDEYKHSIAGMLKTIADNHNVKIQTCGHGNDFEKEGIGKSGCQTAEMFENIWKDIKFKKRTGGNTRTSCGCLMQKSIGEYNTCKNGCKYCYATKSLDNEFNIDNTSPYFITPEIDVEISEAKQESYIEKINKLF